MEKLKILFICVANSARSQIAEGLAKKLFGDNAWIESAGSEPKSVNLYAIKALSEIGIDISKNYSKSIEQLSPEFLKDLDYVITLCAEEVCPVLPSRSAKKLHWPLPDPVTKEILSEVEMLVRFQAVRDEIWKKLVEFKHQL